MRFVVRFLSVEEVLTGHTPLPEEINNVVSQASSVAENDYGRGCSWRKRTNEPLS